MKWAFKMLEIKTKFHFSHEMKLEGKGTDKIINICKFLKFENYLSTHGSSAYLKNDLEKFSKNNIKLYFHNYEHPKYNQIYKPFMPNACILDLLFNEGPSSLKIIQSGRKKLKRFI